MKKQSGILKSILLIVLIMAGCAMVLGTETEPVSAATKKPAKVTISSVQSYDYDSLKIVWKKAKSAKKYQVYRASSKNGTYKIVKTTTSKSYVDKGLTTGKTYYYKVRGVNGSKNGSFSAKKSGVPTLRKVTGVKLSATETTVSLTYNKVNGAGGYQIYRATEKNGEYKSIKSVSKLTYTDTSRKATTTYYYKVRAYKKVNGKYKYGDFSSIQSVTTKSHNYKTTVVEPSCGVEGYTIHSCSECGSKYRDSYTAAREHNYCVPVYYRYWDLYTCFSCRKPSHIDDDGLGKSDVLCGNWGTSWVATIVAYRCENCNSLIDVKDYEHDCDWQEVKGIARGITKCNYCGEQGLTTFAENDDRFGDAGSGIGSRSLHKTNDCVAKCKEEYGEDNFSKYLFTSEDLEYVSYWQCSKCNRIKNNNEPEIEMQVEGKTTTIPLVMDQTAWDDLDGTEWIFPTLEEVGGCGSFAAFQPIFGTDKYRLHPQSLSNYYAVEEDVCTLCGKTIKAGGYGFKWNNHFCNFDKDNLAAALDSDYVQLGQVTGLKVVSSAPIKILKWDEVEGADGYMVYSTSTDGETCVTTADMNYYYACPENLDGTYTYKVKAYKNVQDGKVYGGYSEKLTVKFTTQPDPDEIRSELLDAINKERTARNLKPLKLSETYTASAQKKAEAMYEESSIRAGDDFENGEEFTLYKHTSVDFIIKIYMHNTTKKRLLLSDQYTEIAIGYCGGYWVQQLVEE